MKMLALAGGLAVALSFLAPAHLVSAQEPSQNIGKRHGNLRDAQRLSRQAYDKISAAQRANEFDMNGHAARAKELLEQANEEMKKAAVYLNRR